MTLLSRAVLAAAFALSFPGCAASPAASTAATVAAPAPVLVNPQDAAARAWGIAGSDVPADPAVRLGVLPNGMKYALMVNSTPKDSVIIRFRINVGSLAESEEQRGLAHFLEHMAFNGSTNVPEGEMVKLLERKGLAFGADTNAETSFDYTEYKLDLPQGSDDLIDTGLMLMRETASELTISDQAVDRERGVIASERRARDTAQFRNLVDSLGFYYPTLTLKERLPIGVEAVIAAAPPQRFRDFYRAYYRPERATLVITGDFDVAAMAAKLTQRFADWRGQGTDGADANAGKLDPARPSAAAVYVDPSIPDSVELVRLRPWRFEADMVARRKRLLVEGLGTAMLNRRLEKLALAENAPIQGASMGAGALADSVELLAVSAAAKEGEWRAALALIDAEWRRALQHGFTEAELAEAVANLRTALDNGVTAAPTRRSTALANAIMAMHRGDGRSVFSRPEQRRDLFAAIAGALTVADVNAAFRARHEGYGAPLIRVTAKKPVEGGEAAVLAAWLNSTALAVAPPAAEQVTAFAYTDFGTPGTVVSDERAPDHGIRRVRFANNVMLNIKRTDFQANRVQIAVRVDGGNLLATRADPTRVALGAVMMLGGLEKHSYSDLQGALAGRNVGTSFGAGDDGFLGSATTTPGDLALQAQLYAAYLVAPGWREDGLALIRRVLPQQYAGNDATPAAVMARDVPGILANDDPRLVNPPLERLLALDWSGVRTASADMLARGAIEIGIVGDIDEAAAIDAIARSFGALPPRNAAFGDWTQAKAREFAKNRAPRTLIHKGLADQAELRLYWPATDDSDFAEYLRIDLLSRVLDVALVDELRERLGKTYTPSAGANLSALYPGYGHIMASANVNVSDLAVTEAALRAVAARLASEGPSADLVTRARAPALEAMAKARRENGYWLARVSYASSRADRLARINSAIPMLTAITPDELRDTARRYLRDDRALVIRAVSDKAPKP
jgi:zinc protease